MPFLIRSSFAGLQQTHVALEEASMSVGAGRVNTFFRITIPLIAISILAGSMLSFIYSNCQVGAVVALGPGLVAVATGGGAVAVGGITVAVGVPVGAPVAVSVGVLAAVGIGVSAGVGV